MKIELFGLVKGEVYTFAADVLGMADIDRARR